MTFVRFDRGAGSALGNAAAVLAGLLLAACAAPPAATDWVKTGADDATTSHQVADCRAQANAARGNEQGINQDISATLGRNWQLGGTAPVVDQSMRQQASGYADQVFDSCMRAKGFTKGT